MPIEKRRWSAQTRAIDLATSDIGLAPLPDDPFTRGKCSFKVLEYSASGLPVVASPIGTNAQYVREGVTGFLCVTAGESVRGSAFWLRTRKSERRWGVRARSMRRSSTCSVIGRRFSDLIGSCLRGEPGPSDVSE